MGTIHANTRANASTVSIDDAMGGFTLPAKTVREIVAGSVDVIIQAARLRDGSRRITHITEVVGMEGDVIVTQDLVRYEIEGEDANGGSSAVIAPPASVVRISGTVPAITAKRTALRPLSMPWKTRLGLPDERAVPDAQ